MPAHCDTIPYYAWRDESFVIPAYHWKVKAPKQPQDYCDADRQLVQATVNDPALIARLFRQNAATLWRETAHISSPTAIAAHPSYKAILKLGQDAVPHLLKDMKENRRTWFSALVQITKENPVSVKDAGKTDRMIEAWLRWGKARGRL